MNKEQGRALWLTIIERELADKNDGFQLAGCREKLRRVRFTYGGEMKMTRKDGRMDKAFAYALNSFRSLVKMYNSEFAVAKATEIVETVEALSDNQCGLCGRISKSSWAFIELNGSLKSRLLAKEVGKIKTNKSKLICRDRGLCRKKQQKRDRQRLHMGSAVSLL